MRFSPSFRRNPMIPRCASLVLPFSQNKFNPDAVQEYKKLAQLWPDAAWIQSRLFDLENERPADAKAEGKTYALLIGVSKYRSDQVPPLQFAHQDALVLEKFLKSPRGGALPDSNVVVLTNEAATTAAIRNAFETFLKVRAGAKDTVILLIAAHGVAEPDRGAFLVTYDSDPQDLAATALPMADVQAIRKMWPVNSFSYGDLYGRSRPDDRPSPTMGCGRWRTATARSPRRQWRSARRWRASTRRCPWSGDPA